MKRLSPLIATLGVLCLLIGLSSRISEATHIAGQGNWNALASLPTPVEGMVVASVGNLIFTTHGFSSGDTGLTRAYDINTNAWLPRTSSPINRSELAGDSHGGKIYAVGGRGIGCSFPNVSGVCRDLEVYDPVTDAWAALPPMPTARAGLAAAVVGNKLYAIGGRDQSVPGSGTALACVEAFDIAAGTWSPPCGSPGALAPMPTPRMDVAGVPHGRKIYVMGGATGVNPGVLGPVVATVEVYIPAINVWLTSAFGQLPLMPTPRANLSLATCGNLILALGGRDFPGQGVTRLGTVEAYNTAKNSWSGPLAPIPTPRSEQGSVFHGGRVYVVGSGLFGASLAAHEALDCSSLRP